MALREFSDRAGREWRAWDVTADALHPATRAEDYMRDYLDGWLAFESMDGLAKCRLTPIPEGWNDASVEQLEQWLHEAETVRGDRGSGAFGRASAEVTANPLIPSQGRGPTRTFRFPGGRYWTVTEYQPVNHGSPVGSDDTQAHRVLRFMSGARALDLGTWPADWTTLADSELIELLTTSFPRHNDPSETSTYHRRSGDHEKR